MKFNTDLGVIHDRTDWKQHEGDPDFAGCINVGGEILPVVAHKGRGDFGEYVKVTVVRFETVHANPKFYGLTAKQAVVAELGEPEF